MIDRGCFSLRGNNHHHERLCMCENIYIYSYIYSDGIKLVLLSIKVIWVRFPVDLDFVQAVYSEIDQGNVTTYSDKSINGNDLGLLENGY